MRFYNLLHFSRLINALALCVCLFISGLADSCFAQFPGGVGGGHGGGGMGQSGPSVPRPGGFSAGGSSRGRVGGSSYPSQPNVPRNNFGQPPSPYPPGARPGTNQSNPVFGNNLNQFGPMNGNNPHAVPLPGPSIRNPLHNGVEPTFRPSDFARTRMPVAPNNPKWQQIEPTLNSATDPRSSIERGLGSDRSLQNLMGAVNALERARISGQVRNGYRQEALETAMRGMRENLSDPLAWQVTARFALEDGNQNLFNNTTNAFVQKFPNNPEAHYYKAVVEIQDGNWKAAEKSLLRSKELGMPQDEIARLLKLAIDQQRWIWEYAKIAGFLIAVWLTTMAALYVIGSSLSKYTLESIKQKRIEASDQRDRKKRSTYRIVVGSACVLYYLSMPMLVLSTVSLTAAMAYAALSMPLINLLLLGLVALMGLLTLLTCISGIRALFVSYSNPEYGRPVTAVDEPALWNCVEGVASKVGTRKVNQIRVTSNCEFAVYETGNWIAKLRDRGNRVLIVGSSLMPGFPKASFESVLAHEYAHFMHRDTAGGELALNVERAMNGFIAKLVERGKLRWWDLAIHFLRFYYRMFHQLTLGASRLQEVMADQVAAKVYGRNAFVNGLTHIIRRDSEMNIYMENLLLERVASPALSGANRFYPTPKLTLEESFIVDEIVEAIMTRPTTQYDSHPSPSERVQLVSGLPDNQSFDEKDVVTNLISDQNGKLSSLQSELDKLLNDSAQHVRDQNKMVIDALDKIALQSRDPAILLRRGSLKYQLGNYQCALDDFNTLLQNGNWLDVFWARSLVYQKLDDIDAAIADWNTLLQFKELGNDERFEVLSKLGSTYNSLQQWDKAKAAFDEALALKPKSIVCKRGEAYAAEQLGLITLVVGAT